MVNRHESFTGVRSRQCHSPGERMVGLLKIGKLATRRRAKAFGSPCWPTCSSSGLSGLLFQRPFGKSDLLKVRLAGGHDGQTRSARVRVRNNEASMPAYMTLRIAAVAAAFTVLTSSVAEPSPGEPFDLRVNFADLPDGSPFQLAQQQQVFNDRHVVKHVNGDTGPNVSKYVMSIVSHDCKNARCLQFTYPAGSHGTFLELPGYGASGFVLFMSQAEILNVEFDWLFEPGFDLTSGIGKMPGWPMIGNNSLNKGTQLLLTWRANYHPTRLVFVNQDPESGHTRCN